tara:strand:+ start:6118 stop:6765 length:648 start_codon:yes stop_codon:yes gene_type:complete
MRDLFLPDKIERVLIACESSGVSRNAWNQAGFDCWSVDLLEADDHGEKHIVGCALEVIDDGWDLIIAHPPCTYLCNSGVWMLSDKHLHKDPDRWEKLDEACRFFRAFIDAPAPRVCVENPVPHKYAVERIGGLKPAQYVQPFEYGHPESKKTGLWLKGLPPLKPTNVVKKPASGHWDNQTKSGQNKLGPSKNRWKERSKTYQGIADAMVQQWGNF